MPDPYATRPETIAIDRLILDIPGIDAGQARTIAQALGIRLAATSLRGQHRHIGIDLDGDGDLAARIAAALAERLL